LETSKTNLCSGISKINLNIKEYWIWLLKMEVKIKYKWIFLFKIIHKRIKQTSHNKLTINLEINQLSFNHLIYQIKVLICLIHQTYLRCFQIFLSLFWITFQTVFLNKSLDKICQILAFKSHLLTSLFKIYYFKIIIAYLPSLLHKILVIITIIIKWIPKIWLINNITTKIRDLETISIKINQVIIIKASIIKTKIIHSIITNKIT
jgi:hypothetical protein